MNYQKIYENLTAKDMIATYTEKHHIIPRCIGGSDDASNIVRLTPEAHYVAHQLLVKIYPDNHSLIFAAHMMNNGRSTNKLYGWLKRRHAIAMSNRVVSAETKAKMRLIRQNMPQEIRDKISATLKQRIRTDDDKAKMSAMFKGRTHTAETKAKMRAAQLINPHRLGKNHTDETKAKMSASRKGKPAHNKGTTLSAEVRANMKKQKSKCIHCNLEVSAHIMTRWHGDNCKHKH